MALFFDSAVGGNEYSTFIDSLRFRLATEEGTPISDIPFKDFLRGTPLLLAPQDCNSGAVSYSQCRQCRFIIGAAVQPPSLRVFVESCPVLQMQLGELRAVMQSKDAGTS